MNQDVLSTVTYPKGGSANVAYSIATSTNPELPFPPLTVNAMATNDGLGNYATTTYSYSEGRLFLSQGVRDRKFAGFAAATTTNPDSAIGIYYNQGYGVDTARGEQNDGFGQINHPFRKDVFDLSGNIKQRTYFRWDTIPHGQSTFVGLRRELTEDFGADGSHRDKATAYLYSSSTNDLLQKIEYGEVTGASDGTFTDIGTDKRTAIFSYVASTSVNISLPIEKTLLDNNSATSSNQRLYYDFDLIVIGRPSDDPGGPRMKTFEDLLFESGRPILLAPPIPPTHIGRNVLIAWNCSTEQARVTASAMPFLSRAERITIIVVDGATVPGPSAKKMAEPQAARHRSRHYNAQGR